MKDLDSTQALLDSTISTPEIVDSVLQDEEEEEVFFGSKSQKELKNTKIGRRDTIHFSGSDWKSHKDKLSLSSSSTGRSSLLDAENSIIEEDEDSVFEVEDSPGVQKPDFGEIEFSRPSSQDQEVQELGVSISDSASLEISGIQPLASSQSIQDESGSGIFDSFSDATTEEMLEDDGEEEAEKLAHVKRKILQDSTFMSSVSSLEDSEEDKKTYEQSLTPSKPSIPSVVITGIQDCDSPDIIPASPESVYHTAQNSRRNTSLGGAESPLFDTTTEEMALYDLYGEDYDEVVAGMTKQEKLDLKEKLENRGEEEKKEIRMKFGLPARDPLISVGSTISPFSLSPSSPSPAAAEFLPQELIQDKEEEEPMETETEVSPAVEEGIPSSPRFPSNYMLPTAASLNKLTTRSPSPRKRTPWLPPSPSPSKAFRNSPHNSAKRQNPVSKLPVPVKKPQMSEGTPSGTVRTPLSKKVTGLKAAYADVASPVAAYVKNNPVPHLVQNVKAKEPETPLESTIVEVEEKENNVRLSLLPQCPLPSAVYKASSVVAGEEPSEARDEYEYVTEAYGAVSQSAKVTRHVSRVKVPNPGLVWNEDLLAYDESWNSSPSVAKFKPPGKPVLKSTRRDSGLFDESMMNVSVVETKVVKKVARGKGGSRGRGKGKKRLIDRNPYH